MSTCICQFGSVIQGPEAKYFAGNGTVVVSFRSANPRNDPRIGKTFLSVERLTEDEKWDIKFVDGDWCTKFAWTLESVWWGVSSAAITWHIPADVTSGTYRICHFGARKTILREPQWVANQSTLAYFSSIGAHLIASISDKLGMSGLVGSGCTREFSGCTEPFLVT